MGGWMDGWMDGWVDGWMGGWMDAWVEALADKVHKQGEHIPRLCYMYISLNHP